MLDNALEKLNEPEAQEIIDHAALKNSKEQVFNDPKERRRVSVEQFSVSRNPKV
jgi:hypothetical protein